LRSTVLHFATFFGALALAASVGASAGCEATGSALSDRDRSPPGDDPSFAGEGDTSIGGTDASMNAPPAYRGSPLCRVTPDKCMPDDDGTGVVYGAPCVEPVPDAGALPAGDASTEAKACRLAKSDEELSPSCFPADRRGVDGTTCETGADCAPGFDCVEGEKRNVCRRYCCSGSCAGQASQNGGPMFCDVQKLVDTKDQKAPVCMPLKKCKLLVEGECGTKETCGIVTERGETGCVTIGEAKAGASCESEHCERGSTCLGSPDDRRCYKLCRIGGSDCEGHQECTTGAVFQDATFGVCKDRVRG
jgi:hypothetical protein